MTALLLVALFSTALLLGGMAFFAAVIAPTVFRVLPAEAGGRLIRAVFPGYYLWVLGTAAGSIALLSLSLPDAGIMAAAAGAFRRARHLSVVANLLQMVAAAMMLAGFVF